MLLKNKYIPFWEKYIDEIFRMLENSSKEPQSLSLQKNEFEKYGHRPASNYTFNLEIINGKALNNISGTAVARDLLISIQNSRHRNNLKKYSHYKITLGKEFILKISTLNGK